MLKVGDLVARKSQSPVVGEVVKVLENGLITVKWLSGYENTVLGDAYVKHPDSTDTASGVVGRKFPNGFEVIEAIEKVDEWVILARRSFHDVEEYVTARMSKSDNREWYWGNYFFSGENPYLTARSDLYGRANLT